MDLTVGGQRLLCRQQVKYLGVTLDQRLTWNAHITDIANKGRQRLKICAPIFRSKELQTRSKTTLFKAFIQSILLYACVAWGNASSTILNKLQIVQNLSLRKILRPPILTSNATIHQELHIPYLSHFIHRRSTTTWARIRTHTNKLISQIGSGEPRHRKHKRIRVY